MFLTWRFNQRRANALTELATIRSIEMHSIAVPSRTPPAVKNALLLGVHGKAERSGGE